MYTSHMHPVENEYMPFLLPVVIAPPVNNRRYSFEEISMLLQYSKRMATMYLRLFNAPVSEDVLNHWQGNETAAKDYYQERCEHFQSQVFVYEIALLNFK